MTGAAGKLRVLVVDDVVDMARTVANDLDAAGLDRRDRRQRRRGAGGVRPAARRRRRDGPAHEAGRRSGAPDAGQGDRPDRPRHHHDRVRRDRQRGRGDAAGRVSLHHQAVPAGSPAIAGRTGRARARAVHGERAAAPDAAGEHVVAPAPRREPGHAPAARADREDRRRRVDGADHGRDGDRQGSGHAGDSRGRAARGPAARRGQLRGAARADPRERALRPRAWRLHGRGERPARVVRRRRRAARSFSTRSAIFRWRCRESSCACCSRARCGRSGPRPP